MHPHHERDLGMDAGLNHRSFEMRSDRMHRYTLDGGDIRGSLTRGEALDGTQFGLGERTRCLQACAQRFLLQNLGLPAHVWFHTAEPSR